MRPSWTQGAGRASPDVNDCVRAVAGNGQPEVHSKGGTSLPPRSAAVSEPRASDRVPPEELPRRTSVRPAGTRTHPVPRTPRPRPRPRSRPRPRPRPRPDGPDGSCSPASRGSVRDPDHEPEGGRHDQIATRGSAAPPPAAGGRSRPPRAAGSASSPPRPTPASGSGSTEAGRAAGPPSGLQSSLAGGRRRPDRTGRSPPRTMLISGTPASPARS